MVTTVDHYRICTIREHKLDKPEFYIYWVDRFVTNVMQPKLYSSTLEYTTKA